MWVGPIQTVEGLNRIKRLTFPQVSQNSSGPKAFELCALSFPDLQNGVKTLAPPGPPACQLTQQILGRVRLHSHVTQFSIINFITHTMGSAFSGEL